MEYLKMCVQRFTPSEGENQQTRVITGLGYLLPLFFLPLILRPESKPGKHCANQGLTLLALTVLLRIAKLILGFIPIIGWVTDIVLTIAIVAVVLYALFAYFTYYQKGELMKLPYCFKLFV